MAEPSSAPDMDSSASFQSTSIAKVNEYWNARPCNIRHSPKPVGTKEYFDEVEARKYFVEHHIPGFADFERWRGKKVLEIGCGIGTLTGALAARAGRVVAIDVDPRCVAAAQITQRFRDNVTVVQGDALLVEPAGLGLGQPWLAAGNLPYQLTGPILSRLFELPAPPAAGVFLVQREVAARLSAQDGEWSLATVALRSIAEVERLRDVPPASFEPVCAYQLRHSMTTLSPRRSKRRICVGR